MENERNNSQLSTINSQLKKPQLRFPEFKGEWKKCVIGDVANKITDGTHDTPKPTNEGIPFLTAIHVRDGFIDFDNCYFLPEEIHNQIYRRCNPERDDLLMVKIGAGVATSAKVNVDYKFSLKNVALIKPNKSIIDSDFFTHTQRKNSARLKHQISSGGAQPFLSLQAIAKLKLTIPKNIPEQTKIATFLTAVDKRIKLLQKKKAELTQYKKGVMQRIFAISKKSMDNGELKIDNEKNSSTSSLTNSQLSTFNYQLKKDSQLIRFKPSKKEIDEYINMGKIKLMENGEWKMEN